MNKSINEIKSSYQKQLGKKRIILIFLLLLSLIFIVLSICAGASNISFFEVVKALFRQGDETNILIVYNIRMPRVLAAIIAGGGLAISGCIMQNVLKNPMASPSTLGVGNASVFGANFAIIVLGAGTYYSSSNSLLNISNPYIVSIFSFLFALIAIGIILLLSHLRKFSSESIVLAGIAIGSIFQALTTLIQYFAIDNQISSAIYWTFGNLSRATYKTDLIMLVVVLLSFIYFYLKRWDYSAMANGTNIARTLGVKTHLTTIISLLLASLITAVCVSFLGIIGFVGLIAPQIMRRFVGDDFKYLLPSSFLCGSALLLISDTLGRIVIAGTSLPVGAITSLLGGPMFIYILLRRKENRV